MEDNYDIVMVSAIHQHELAIVGPLPLPPHPNPLGCPRTLGSLWHIANSHRLSILHMVVYTFQRYSLSHHLTSRPPTVSKSLFCVSESPLLPCGFFWTLVWKESVQGPFIFLYDPAHIIGMGEGIGVVRRCSEIENLHLLKVRAQDGLAGSRYFGSGKGRGPKLLIVSRMELQYENRWDW